MPRGEPRIYLGWTLGRELDALVALRWFDLFRAHPLPGPNGNGRAAYTVQARNNVMTQAFQCLDEWDALLFWDSDQLPPERVPGPLHRDPSWKGGYFTEYVVHRARERRDVTVFLYYSREDIWKMDGEYLVHGPHEPVAYMRQPDGSYRYLALAELHPMLMDRGPHPVGGGGTGAMLIDKSVLLRLADLKGTERVFDAPILQPGQVGGLRGSQWTEDLYFCEEVTQRLGCRVTLDTAGESAHRRDHWVYSPDYLRARGVEMRRPDDPPRGVAPVLGEFSARP